MAARKAPARRRGRSSCLYIGSWMRAVGGFGASRAWAPGAARMRGGAKRQPDAAQAPEPSIRPRSAALELSASCVRAGFPHPGRRGRV